MASKTEKCVACEKAKPLIYMRCTHGMCKDCLYTKLENHSEFIYEYMDGAEDECCPICPLCNEDLFPATECAICSTKVYQQYMCGHCVCSDCSKHDVCNVCEKKVTKEVFYDLAWMEKNSAINEAKKKSERFMMMEQIIKSGLMSVHQLHSIRHNLASLTEQELSALKTKYSSEQINMLTTPFD